MAARGDQISCGDDTQLLAGTSATWCHSFPGLLSVIHDHLMIDCCVCSTSLMIEHGVSPSICNKAFGCLEM
eukprot:scaffold118512_cov61-Attheya_sp.AAC.2